MEKFQVFQPLAQLQSLLCNLNQEAYAQKLNVLNGASVGQHARHIIEFYECLLMGHHSGVVNYDKRLRQTRIEDELTYCQHVVENSLQILQDINTDSTFLLESDFGTIESSLQRELLYLAEHTIHHLAIMRIGIQTEMQSVQIDANLGVAPSTIKFRSHNTVSVN